MSAADAWMPLYVGDYMRDTARLSTAHHGAYLLLIMDYWTQGPPPDNDVELAAIIKQPIAEWRDGFRPILSKFFQIESGVWRHKRIDAEKVRCVALIAQRKSAGLASGAARRRRQLKVAK
jgi:uncharacterized protein YdaU (DUF1376 family)